MQKAIEILIAKNILTFKAKSIMSRKRISIFDVFTLYNSIGTTISYGRSVSVVFPIHVSIVGC